MANRVKYQEEEEKLFKERKYYEALNKFSAAIEIDTSYELARSNKNSFEKDK